MNTKAITTMLLALLVASMLSMIPNASATTTCIDFDTYPAGPIIQNQYQGVGVIFSSQGVIWETSESQSLPNFLVGYPAYYPPTWPWAIYPITFDFVAPGTSTPAVTDYVSVTLISVGWSTVTATAYDSSGNVLHAISVTHYGSSTIPWNGLNNKDTITFFGVGDISTVDIRITTPYYWGEHQDGFGIDDLCFEAIPVLKDIDIKPGSYPNSINMGENGNLPVAILGSETFDVTTIDPASIMLGTVDMTTRGSAKAPKLAYSFEDVNEDGYVDLIAFFSVPELVAEGVLTETTTELTLTANLYDGTPITGTDSVRVVPP
jgi:hypothetical protein